MAFKPTEQQEAIYAEAESGVKSLVVEAFAGTGKTTTLKGVAERLPGEKIVYAAFNKAIQREAERKMPKNTTSKTAHSLAYGVTVPRRLGKERHTWYKMEVIEALEGTTLINDTADVMEGDDRRRRAAFAVFSTLSRFCNSDKAQVDADEHIPKEFMAGLGKKERKKATKALAGDAQRTFDAMIAEGSTLPYTPDVYLKLWQLMEPTLPYDTILFDEAQDASPVMSAVVNLQAEKGKKTFFIGDQRQAIYGWRGAIDAMKNAKGKRLGLTKSFRFGENIASKAQEVLDLVGEKKKLIGAAQDGGIVLDDPLITAADAVLCRGNAGVIRECLDALDGGLRPAVVGGTGEAVSLLFAVHDLWKRQADPGHPRPKHPEINIFTDWDELYEFSESEDGNSLKPIVKIVDAYRSMTPQLAKRLKYEVEKDEADANVIISTAHKAKGREWNSVRMCDDFMPVVDGEGEKAHIITEEANLVYVTFTRAMRRLNLGGFGLKLEDDKRKLDFAREFG